MAECKVYDVKADDYDTMHKILKEAGHSDTKIMEIMNIHTKQVKDFTKPKGVVSHDHPPCQCGSIDFLRTGTCFVCRTCGESQGCS